MLAGCNVLKPYDQNSLDKSAVFRVGAQADTASIGRLQYQQMFKDSALQTLIEKALVNNLDLKTAFSKVLVAQADFQQSKQAFFPTLSAGLSVPISAGGAGSDNSANSPHSYQTMLTSSWEADLWGKLKSAKRASLASLLQTEANRRAVRTALIADVAASYYSLLALKAQQDVAEQSVTGWQKTVDVMKELKKADVVTSAAIVQSEASKFAVAATLPDIRLAIFEQENRLNFLVGNSPGPIAASSLDAQQGLQSLSTGLAVQMLANRPDVQAAEYGFRYAFEMSNVARSYFYPSLTIGGAAGLSSLTSFFSAASWISSLTAGLTQPIVNRGANRSRLRISEQQQQQAAIAFKSVMLTAAGEVSNAVFAYNTASEKILTRKSQLDNLRKSVDYTQQLVRYGFANYTEVLTAQQSLLTAELNSINDHLQQLSAGVALYRSLGGGAN